MFTQESILYMYKTNISPYFEYCWYIWYGYSARYLEIIDRMQRMSCNVIGPGVLYQLLSRFYHCNLVCLCFFYRNSSNEHYGMVPKLYEFQRNVRLAARSSHFPVEMSRCIHKIFAKYVLLAHFSPEEISFGSLIPSQFRSSEI